MGRQTILLTGFEPFDGAAINPSAEVVRQVAGQSLPGIDLHPAILPVVSETAPRLLFEQLAALQPDAFIGLGEARGRPAITIEQVGANELNFRIPDNSGLTVCGQPIVVDGPPSYPVTIPVGDILVAIRAAGIPAALSENAGRYLCNQILYQGLHWAAQHRPTMQVGFIHLPSLPAQMARETEPKASMALPLQVTAVETALQRLIDNGSGSSASRLNVAQGTNLASNQGL